jgi:glycosyltransferase involved in cell wall biosynthesis
LTGAQLRILLLTHNLAGLGGSYMRAFSLARQLAGFGHSVSLLAARREPGLRTRSLVRDRVDIIEMPDLFPERLRHGGLSLIDTVFRVAWVSSRNFDVIHAFDHRPAVALPALRSRTRGGVLVSDWADLWGKQGIGGEREGVGGWFLRTADEYWEPRFRFRVDGVTAISRMLSDRAGRLGIAPERRLILPAGANVDLIRPQQKTEARRHYDLPPDAHIVVSSGFAPYDEELLAETMAAVLAADSNAWAVTAGARSGTLQRAVRKRALEGRLRILGTVPLGDLEKVLGCADVLLLPYSRRPVNSARFPNRFGDFIAAGRAIVTNRTGDLGELVAKHQLGVLSPETPQDMAESVVGLFEDQEMAAVLGDRARSFAEGHLNWTTLARGVEEFYEAIIQAGPGWPSARGLSLRLTTSDPR